MSSKPQVLATDDQPEMLRLISRSLAGRCRCELAESADQARGYLAEREFDLALCDIQMPGESGLSLARHLAAEHPDTAVLFVSGEDDPAVVAEAHQLGAHGYLIKPFWPGQLQVMVTSSLRRRRLEILQRRREAELSERLRLLMDRAPVSIFMKDRERRFVFANRVAHEALGLSPEEMIGRHTSELLGPDAERHVAETDERVLREGRSFAEEQTLDLGLGERTVLNVKFPYLDAEGEIAGVYGISTDISDRKRAEALQRQLAEAQARAIEDLRASREETVDRLARAIERHDTDTGLHISRMATVAAFLGAGYGLPEEDVILLRAAAPMHDVGKIATPDAILRKPGPLSSEERMVMEQHTMVGYEILAGSESALLQMAATIALTHHERWDGEGYPQKLKGEGIPVEGRIVALADVFDALLSDRSYRRAMSVDDAVAMIEYESGTHFDPEVVDILLANLSEALALRA